MVDIDYRGKGLGTAMNRILNEVGFGIGLRLFETVSKDNVASYRSAISASNVRRFCLDLRNRFARNLKKSDTKFYNNKWW